jgi:hypothetical protein
VNDFYPTTRRYLHMQSPTSIPVTDMPVIDSPLDPEVADGLGDEMLLHAAAETKVQTVRGRFPNESRAWASSGSVD